MKTSKAQLRTLEAVRDGSVIHRYGAMGNAYQAPVGVSPRVLHELEANGLIEDERKSDGKQYFAYKSVLTNRGRTALKAQERDGMKVTRDDLAVLRCWHCDFASGQRGCDRCVKCDGTGSVFWISGRSYPYTPEGEKRALTAHQRSGE